MTVQGGLYSELRLTHEDLISAIFQSSGDLSEAQINANLQTLFNSQVLAERYSARLRPNHRGGHFICDFFDSSGQRVTNLKTLKK